MGLTPSATRDSILLKEIASKSKLAAMHVPIRLRRRLAVPFSAPALNGLSRANWPR
jgi:hypothetical protein